MLSAVNDATASPPFSALLMKIYSTGVHQISCGQDTKREEAELKKQLNPEKPPDQRVSPEGNQELICYHGAEREEAELK